MSEGSKIEKTPVGISARIKASIFEKSQKNAKNGPFLRFVNFESKITLYSSIEMTGDEWRYIGTAVV